MKTMLRALNAAAMLAGCVPMIRAPVIEPPGTEFEGIRMLLTEGVGTDPVTLV